ncbi:MAG: hypothetical protein ABJK37_23645 [Paraglaciecola sp.]|uniref:hypothetical protein n=1 Tax=Paraglaciecola sp. TaxID=1920173 RepID=UPI0032996A66
MLNIKSLISFCKPAIHLRNSIFAFILILAACTTPIELVGERHQSAAQKWYALSQYTSSELPVYGFTVIAQLGVNNKNGQFELALQNINLQPNADHVSLDLLRPDFMQKYVCDPKCTQLVEYAGENTLLSDFLELYEFELFAFYGEMYVLNSAWVKLSNENAQVLGEYLTYLSNKQDGFDSLNDFIVFLKEASTLSAYREFINDPMLRHTSLVKQFYLQPKSKKQTASFSDANWNEGQLTNDPTQNWDLTSEPKELETWTTLLETNTRTSQWIAVRDLPIINGTVVCSFADSYFGVVQSVSNKQVEVFIQGQARKNQDGLITNVTAGSLFQENANLEFLPMAENKQFIESDIAPCNIQS